MVTAHQMFNWSLTNPENTIIAGPRISMSGTGDPSEEIATWMVTLSSQTSKANIPSWIGLTSTSTIVRPLALLYAINKCWWKHAQWETHVKCSHVVSNLLGEHGTISPKDWRSWSAMFRKNPGILFNFGPTFPQSHEAKWCRECEVVFAFVTMVVASRRCRCNSFGKES